MADASWSYRNLLGIPGLPALLAATCLSRLADRMFTLAIVLYALSRFHATATAGWLSFAAVAPGLIISPIAGALLDRIGPPRAIVADMAASSFLVLALIMADWLGRGSLSTVVVLVSLFSLSSPLSAAGVRTALPRLVPSPARAKANGLDTAIHAVVDVLGPALAGTVAGLAGPGSALFVIGLIYGLAAVAMIAIPNPPMARRPGTSLFRQALNAVVRVGRHPTLRGLAVSYTFYQLAWGILVVAVPVYAVQAFASSVADLASGLLWSCIGVAGGFGALAAGLLRTQGRERSVMIVAMLLTAPALFPVAAWGGLIGLLAGLAAAGVLAGPIDVGLLTLRQRRTDPAELGRVLSVSMSLNMAGFPIGTALAGLLLSWSPASAFFAAAAACVLGALAARTLIPKHDDPGKPDPAATAAEP